MKRVMRDWPTIFMRTTVIAYIIFILIAISYLIIRNDVLYKAFIASLISIAVFAILFITSIIIEIAKDNRYDKEGD